MMKIATTFEFCILLFVILGNSTGNKQDLGSFNQFNPATDSDEDVKPLFISINPDKMYVTNSHPVTIHCAALKCLALQINCFNNKDLITKTTTRGMLDQSHDTFFIKDKKKLPPQLIMTQKQLDRVSKSVEGLKHEINFTLTEKTVESWFIYSFWCRCEAIYQTRISNGTYKEDIIYSEKTFIDISYIDGKFKQEPNSASLYHERYVKLTCIPPDGKPKPTIYWRKNGERLITEDQTKVHVSEDGSLVIYSTASSDSGLYECVAENQAGVRISKAAKLEVLDTDQTGNWKEWASWNACPSECKPGQYCAEKCRKYVRRRSRVCRTEQEPINNGISSQQQQPPGSITGRRIIKAKCPGESLQTESCAKPCKIDGGWSVWSPWSLCQPDCTKQRIRKCSAPLPQAGGQICQPIGGFIEKVNCSVHLCNRSPSSSNQNNGANDRSSKSHYVVRDMVVYSVLSVALFLLIFVTLLVFCLQRKHILFSTRNYQLSCKMVPNKNGLIMLKSVEEKLVKDSNSESGITYNSNSVQNPSQSTIFKESPLNPSSGPSSGSLNSNSVKQPLLPPLPPPPDTPVTIINSKQVSFLPSCHYTEVPLILTNSSSMKTQNSYDSSNTIMGNSTISTIYPNITNKPISTPVFSESMLSNKYTNNNSINKNGGKIVLGSTGVSVIIPPDSFIKDDIDYLIELYTRDTHEHLIEFEDYTQLSSIVFCTITESAVLNKPVIISFPHSIDFNSLENWDLKIVSMNTDFTWKIYLDDIFNGDEPNESYCQITETSCTLMTFNLKPICLIGAQKSLYTQSIQLSNPVNQAAQKRICLMTFLQPITAGKNAQSILLVNSLQISCYFFLDTKDLRDSLLAKIAGAGCRIFDRPKTFILRQSNDSITMTFDVLNDTASSAWKIKLKSKFQEIQINDLWNIRAEPFYIRHINLEQSDMTTVSTPMSAYSLQARLALYQNNYYHERIENSITLNAEIVLNTKPGTSNNYHIQNYSISKLIPPNKVFRLSENLIKELAAYLDPPRISQTQWKTVAKQLGFSQNLEYFLNQTSPTEYLLMLWESENREETALLDLQSTLRVMGLLEITKTLNNSKHDL